MPKKWIDKKSAQRFRLVHRAQDDPLIYDNEAPQQVLAFMENKNQTRVRAGQEQAEHEEPELDEKPENKHIITGERLTEQEAEFREQGRRENEGEAATYGILYDDSKYDYMQHLRPIGKTADAVFIAKKSGKEKPNRKDLLLKPEYLANNNNATTSTNPTTNEMIQLPKELLPSETTVPRNYGEIGNIPEALAGFQPDMDPRLREVLDALDDEAYVEEDEDVFGELLTSGQLDEDEEDEYYDEDDDEWNDFDADAVNSYQVTAKEGEQEWETAFRQFKIDETRKSHATGGSDDEYSEEDDEERDEVGSLKAIPAYKKRTKPRGGAKTDLSGVSMTSSAMFRNEGLTLLDDRFDKIEQEYEEDSGDEHDNEPVEQFDMGKERTDLEDILDDFLDNYVVEGKHLYKMKK